MDSSTLDTLLAWIGQNPWTAGAVVFLVAFLDALLLIGFAVPSLPLLFGVGTLVGLGLINPWYAIACAAAGAFLGDALSFGFGRSQGSRLRRMWPFSRHPEWLVRGEVFFNRHGLKGIVIARYVGAVRPLVPAIAGMLHMSWRRYLPVSAIAASTWSFAFVAPGWLFGAWLDLLSAVAGRLALVVGVLLVLLGLMGLSVFALYRVLAPRAALLVERMLAWSHRHPVLGRYSSALIDPKRPESPSLALLALGLLGAGWAFFSLLLMELGQGEPSALDLRIYQGFLGLRNPLADQPMAVLSVLGDWPVLGPAFFAVAAWLLWRRRTTAALHWVAAAVTGLALVSSLGWLLDMPRPPAALLAPGFSFPSVPVTMATVVYGFFAVLVARELPGRRRGWPYVVAGMLIACVAFSRLYLGAHWFSDVLAGLMLGLAWITGLGIGYRRRMVRSFWVRPVSLVFFLCVGLSAAWFGPRQVPYVLAQFDPPLVREPMDMQRWWREDWQVLPEHRNHMIGPRAWPLNVEYAGELPRIEATLQAEGWERLQAGGWEGLLRTLANDAAPDNLPVLPTAHRGRAEALMMARSTAGGEGLTVLRLWPAPYVLMPQHRELWVGTVQTLHFNARLDLISFWEAQTDDGPAREALLDSIADSGLEQAQGLRSDSVVNVIRLREASLH